MSYGVTPRGDVADDTSERIDFDEIRDQAKLERPKMIVAGIGIIGKRRTKVAAHLSVAELKVRMTIVGTMIVTGVGS